MRRKRKREKNASREKAKMTNDYDIGCVFYVITARQLVFGGSCTPMSE